MQLEPDRTTLQRLYFVKLNLVCEGSKGIFGAELHTKPILTSRSLFKEGRSQGRGITP
jgi:hypothetical protein